MTQVAPLMRVQTIIECKMGGLVPAKRHHSAKQRPAMMVSPLKTIAVMFIQKHVYMALSVLRG